MELTLAIVVVSIGLLVTVMVVISVFQSGIVQFQTSLSGLSGIAEESANPQEDAGVTVELGEPVDYNVGAIDENI